MTLCRSGLLAVTSPRCAICGTSPESGELMNLEQHSPRYFSAKYICFTFLHKFCLLDFQIHENLPRVSRNLPLDWANRNCQQLGGQFVNSQNQFCQYCQLSPPCQIVSSGNLSFFPRKMFHLVSQERYCHCHTLAAIASRAIYQLLPRRLP